jgi:lipopolysaccharide export LptBFGC system permease protein LptF
MMLFGVFDKLRFSPASITERNSNLVAGLLFGVIFLVLLMTYTEVAAGEVFDAILVTILTALTAFTVFLLLFSLGMED